MTQYFFLKLQCRWQLYVVAVSDGIEHIRIREALSGNVIGTTSYDTVHSKFSFSPVYLLSSTALATTGFLVA